MWMLNVSLVTVLLTFLWDLKNIAFSSFQLFCKHLVLKLFFTEVIWYHKEISFFAASGTYQLQYKLLLLFNYGERC